MDLTNKTSGWELQENPLPQESLIIPHCIAVFGRANEDYEGTTNTPVQVADAYEAANLFGYGSQLHRLCIPWRVSPQALCVLL